VSEGEWLPDAASHHDDALTSAGALGQHKSLMFQIESTVAGWRRLERRVARARHLV